MKIDTARFGTVEFTEEDTLTFQDGLLGFPDQRHFLILNHREKSPFRWLQSIEDPNTAFLMLDPAHFHPDYAPELPDGIAEELELGPETPRIVYTFISIPQGRPQDMTANLSGPIIINAERKTGRQVVLEDPQWTPKHRILKELKSLCEQISTKKVAA